MARVLLTRRWLLIELAHARSWLLVELARKERRLLIELAHARRWLLVESARKKRRLLVELARAKVVWPDVRSSLEFKVALLLFAIFTVGLAVLAFIAR
jgi:hypothetical protein